MNKVKLEGTKYTSLIAKAKRYMQEQGYVDNEYTFKIEYDRIDIYLTYKIYGIAVYEFLTSMFSKEPFFIVEEATHE